MTVRPTSVARFEALPNPRGGRVPTAQAALVQAGDALEQHGDVATPLQQAARALRDAGWLGAARFADMLLLVSPLAVAQASAAGAVGGPDAALSAGAAPGLAGAEAGSVRMLFCGALTDLAEALERRNLRELSCSPALFAWQRSLRDALAPHTPGFSLAFEDVALAARPVPSATLRAQPGQRLAQLRARYEAALLPALKTRSNGSRAAAAWADAAFGELDACLGELASPDPYDFWRLAAACGKALRRGAQTWGDDDARRFYARCNLLLADHAQGMRIAPQSLVRATLALLWRDYALFGAAAEDADDVELLHDYGLTVDWHVAGTQASETLWEADSAQADQVASHAGPARELGALVVNANAYEDFLQTADAAMAVLGDSADASAQRGRPDPGAALLKAEAAYRLGAAAWALGLGHVGLLADALGLAWRRTAHVAMAQPAASHPPLAAPDADALTHAIEQMRGILHKIAAGIAQPDATAAVQALAHAIVQAGSDPGDVPASP